MQAAKERGREDTACKDEGTFCRRVGKQSAGRRDALEVKNRCRSFRGPEFCSQHMGWRITTVCNSSSKECSAFFWPPRVRHSQNTPPTLTEYRQIKITLQIMSDCPELVQKLLLP